MEAWMTDQVPDPYETKIASVQSRLRGYVFVLSGRADEVGDIVQETNRVLWRKRDDFDPETDFWAWASRIAYFQVMAQRKRQSRDRHVFGDELLHLMADEFAARPAPPSPDSERLERCLSRLPDRQRDAVRSRYFDDENLPEIATGMNLNENAVSQLLFRARKNLRECLSRDD